MSKIQKLLRNTQKLNNSRNTGAIYAPGASEEFINKWMVTLSSKATSVEGKAACAQLNSLVQFYNRAVNKDIKQIDWDHWKNTIQTPGLVEKVQQNYKSLTSEEYDTQSVAKQVLSAPSKELESLDNALIFHGALWLNAYSDYTMFLWELEEYGDPNDYLMHENYDFFQGLEAELEELTETHNYLAGSKDDLNLRGYLSAQFGWGKKVVTFYRHPADDFKCGKATKNILGR